MNIEGFVDWAEPDRVAGWVTDRDRPDQALSVEIVLDGRLIAAATADELRIDLRRTAIGTGAYGFTVSFPTAISRAEIQRIFVSAVATGGERVRIPRFVPAAIFTPRETDTVSHPVFVLGSPRSGTSVVTHALQLNTRYVGPHEGHVLDLLGPLSSVVKQFYALKGDIAGNPENVTMLRDVPRGYFDEAFARLFRDIAATFFTAPFWLDKTPTSQMIRAAPRLAAIWPNARFIFMRRRGFENMLSRERKFKNETFQTHCSRWADCMAAWLEVRHLLAGRAIEIDQFALAREPASVAGLLAELLSLEPREHADVAAFLARERTEQTGASITHVEPGPPAMWDETQRRIFADICLPLFAPFGYAEDSRYFLSVDKGVAWARI